MGLTQTRGQKKKVNTVREHRLGNSQQSHRHNTVTEATANRFMETKVVTDTDRYRDSGKTVTMRCHLLVKDTQLRPFEYHHSQSPWHPESFGRLKTV